VRQLIKALRASLLAEAGGADEFEARAAWRQRPARASRASRMPLGLPAEVAP
jgi:hypothetical protein